jgi:RNA polymerase sigma-B factor
MRTTGGSRRGRDDVPETDGDFRRLARLPAGPERDRLRQRIICAWLPVAERLALRFRNKSESTDDLVQVAAEALIKAVDRYDPDRGHAFPTFAVPTIVGELKRHFRDHLWTLHVPRGIQEARARTRATRDALQQELGGRSPTIAEICRRTGLSEAHVLLGLEASANCVPISLDAPAHSTEQHALADTLGTDDGALELVVDRASLRPLLAGLPERERRILYLRFFAGLTQSQIAETVGVSQMQISRILSRVCHQLRQQLDCH